MVVRFDDALPQAIATAKEFLEGQTRITIVRDASGAITVILPDEAVRAVGAPLAEALHLRLGAFSLGPRRVLLGEGDLIDPDGILNSPDAIPLRSYPGAYLIDRLLTNQDWLRSPLPSMPRIPMATAFSIKGGVGRSTAFAVWAWSLARAGRRVLVVDLDLEAPGIASHLLTELPDFGLVDWLVEDISGQADAGFLEEVIGISPLAPESGQILVVPAFGTKSGDYVAKLGRIYMPSAHGGEFVGLANRLSRFIEQVSQRLEPPDIILLDARAGLHDIGAAAVTQLGAEVFMFARNEVQSWSAYRHLLRHLQMAKSVKWGMPDEDLRWRVKMVAAQMDGSEAARERWLQSSYAAWSEFYDDQSGSDGESNGLLDANFFDITDEAAPHHPLQIHHDPRLMGINLVDDAVRPDWSVVERSFQDFLVGATFRVLGCLDASSNGGGE